MKSDYMLLAALCISSFRESFQIIVCMINDKQMSVVRRKGFTILFTNYTRSFNETILYIIVFFIAFLHTLLPKLFSSLHVFICEIIHRSSRIVAFYRSARDYFAKSDAKRDLCFDKQATNLVLLWGDDSVGTQRRGKNRLLCELD